MPSADKRARKKENARAAREEREAAIKRKKRLRSIMTMGIVTAVFVGLVVILTVAGGDDDDKTATTTTTIPADPKIDPAKTYTATIETNFGTITAKLDAKNAPIGAGHFVNLADQGVYNGSRWHRIIKDFVIQGGAPDGDLAKDYGRTVVGERPEAYKVGDLAAAKTEADEPGTFDSQFFIVTGSQGTSLPTDYAAFGTVTSGMDVVRKIEALETDEGQEPTVTAAIDKVTISTSDQPAGATTSTSPATAPSTSTSTTAPAR